MSQYTGEYGGRVLRAFKGDVFYIVGAEIPAELAMSWPIANRKALFSTHKVEWYGPPADEKKQKVATPVKKDEKKEEKKSTKKAPAVNASGGSRRRRA